MLTEKQSKGDDNAQEFYDKTKVAQDHAAWQL